MTSPLTAGQALSAQARLQPDRIGAHDLERAMTFRQWNARACRLGNALLGIGLGPGDRVGVLAYNRVEWLEIYTAAAKAALVAVPLNFRLVAPEIRYILQDCGVSAVIAEDALCGPIDEIRDEIALPDGRFVRIGGRAGAGWRDYEALIAGAAETEPGAPVAVDAPWCLMYTSGTTGKPKGAIRCHRDMAMLALMTEVELRLGRRDEALLVMPMCHANSLYFFASFLACGAAVGVFSRPSFDPGLCLHTFAGTGATFTSLVPTHYEMMLDTGAAQPGARDFGRVEKLMISSAPARAETKRAVMEMFPSSGLFELYGSTEAGWVTMLHPEEQFDRLGTVGREVVGSAPVRLLDDAGNEVPDGQPGELYSCGPYAFAGYWNLPDKTAQAFRGEYLTVGDVALRDGDGYIRLIDRKANMIISGGEKIYPAEVEAVLAQHRAVRDVAVVGRPDDRWGERVEAAVVLKPGAELTAPALIDWARERMAGYKRPRGVTFLSAGEMPRTATGKIQHGALRDLIAGRNARE